jgi:hypothetical protein
MSKVVCVLLLLFALLVTGFSTRYFTYMCVGLDIGKSHAVLSALEGSVAAYRERTGSLPKSLSDRLEETTEDEIVTRANTSGRKLTMHALLDRPDEYCVVLTVEAPPGANYANLVGVCYAKKEDGRWVRFWY